MRKPQLSFLFIIIIVLPLYLNSPASATQSRLSAMGDLSIVIEDESNKIDLWDFAGNPAGLLDDEEGSTVTGNFLYSIEEPDYYSSISYPYPEGRFFVKRADILNNRILGVFRKKDKFALGIGGDDCERTIKDMIYKFKIRKSNASLVINQNLTPKTSLGLALEYTEYHVSYDKRSSQEFDVTAGLSTTISDLVCLGGTLAYKRFHPTANFSDVTNCNSLEFSFQSFLAADKKVKMGMETVLAFRRTGWGWGDYEDFLRGRHNEYCSIWLKFKGVYDLSSKFSIGLYFNDNDLFVNFYDPFYDYYLIPVYDFMIRHLGLGGIYRIRQGVLIGLEYHIQDTARERCYFQHHRFIKESINVGAEVIAIKQVALRGGFIRAQTTDNPYNKGSKQGWRNSVTFGLGYEMPRTNLLLDIAYRYSLGTIEIWEFYSPYPLEESKRNIIEISIKKSWL
jgi:hypothetical protein